MKTTKKVKVRNGYPVYAIAVVFFLSCMILRVHSVIGLIVTALAAAAAYLICRGFMPDEIVEVVEEIPDPEPADPEVAELKRQRDSAVGEMRRINAALEDANISERIDRIEDTTGKIFSHVMEYPEKKNQIRRFMNYYLPTTINLLSQYEKMEQLGVSGENIDASKARIEEMLEMVCTAFDRQLDALFAGNAMDISADVTVLQNMMQQEGLTESAFDNM